jgi:hypothetical protein
MFASRLALTFKAPDLRLNWLRPAALALAMALPTCGATPVATSSFSLAFPEGWKLAPPGPTELPVVVQDSALDVSCLFTVVVFSHPTAFADLKVPASSFSHGDSVGKVEDGTLTLGGRKFLYAEYHGSDSDSVNNRVRAYYDLYDSTHLLCAFVDYIAPQGSPDVAVMETALAGITYPGAPTAFHGPRGFRGLRAQARPVPDRMRRDVLGRPRLPGAQTRLLAAPR